VSSKPGAGQVGNEKKLAPILK
jgi:hypothetical protein